MCLSNFLSTLALLFVGIAQAECVDICSYSKIQLGANYTYANIKIEDDSFHGNMGGIQGSYEYQSLCGPYGGLKATWKEGSTKHSSSHRNLTYVDVQERIGYTLFPLSDEWAATLFTGFGFRYYHHRLHQSHESTIKFDYNEFYVPVGFLSEYCFSPCLTFGLDFTWMPQVYSTVKINPLKGARWCLRKNLSNFLVELPLSYYFNRDFCYTLIFKPFYEHWEDGRSTAKTFSGQKLGLSKNIYNFWGAEFNLVLTF